MSDIADDSQFIIDITVQSKLLDTQKTLAANNVIECEECGEKIPTARKKAMPSAKHCIDCANEIAKAVKQFGRI
jgi:phage/conjugal plasmid C-4 type zinc finger TraR family protein